MISGKQDDVGELLKGDLYGNDDEEDKFKNMNRRIGRNNKAKKNRREDIVEEVQEEEEEEVIEQNEASEDIAPSVAAKKRYE